MSNVDDILDDLRRGNLVLGTRDTELGRHLDRESVAAEMTNAGADLGEISENEDNSYYAPPWRRIANKLWLWVRGFRFSDEELIDRWVERVFERVVGLTEEAGRAAGDEERRGLFGHAARGCEGVLEGGQHVQARGALAQEGLGQLQAAARLEEQGVDVARRQLESAIDSGEAVLRHRGVEARARLREVVLDQEAVEHVARVLVLAVQDGLDGVEPGLYFLIVRGASARLGIGGERAQDAGRGEGEERSEVHRVGWSGAGGRS